jgi:hypothetical protein
MITSFITVILQLHASGAPTYLPTWKHHLIEKKLSGTRAEAHTDFVAILGKGSWSVAILGKAFSLDLSNIARKHHPLPCKYNATLLGLLIIIFVINRLFPTP